MSRNSGKPSEREFEYRIKGRLIRIWDSADLAGLNGRVVADFGKPSDFLVVTAAGVTFAEVKSSQSKSSFTYANIEKGQRSTAALCAASGCGTTYNFYLHALALERWFILTADEFVADIKAGIKSRKWESLQSWA